MTPLRREAAYHALCAELYRPSRIARRVARIPAAGFPRVHLLSLMKQLPVRRALSKAREAWVEEHGAALASASPPAPRRAFPERLASATRMAALAAWGLAIATLATVHDPLDEVLWRIAGGVDHLHDPLAAASWAALAALGLAAAWHRAVASRSRAARWPLPQVASPARRLPRVIAVAAG